MGHRTQRNIILVKITTAGLILFALLFLTPGCTLLSPPPGGNTPENQLTLKKLVSAKKYHRALNYLQKMQLDETSSTYQSQHRRITRLIRNLEQEVVKKTTEMTVQGNYAAAIKIVGQALEDIPESGKLLELRSSLEKARDKRMLNTRHNLLLSEAEYQISQLEWHEEQALLKKSSLFSRWRIRGMKNSLKSLHPDLIECAREELAARQVDIAERCLHMAAMIEDSEVVNQLLSQIKSGESGSALVPLSEEKKIRPASATAPSFLQMEAKLKKELEAGELLKAHATLAELTRFPGKEEQLKTYRQLLDHKQEKRITRLLQEGSELYRLGKIAQARDAWRKVLTLDPDNHTANEKIVRADKVLKRIEDLQKAQQKSSAEQ